MMLATVLLLVAILLLLFLVWQLRQASQGQSMLWDVLWRGESRQDEQSRTLTGLAAQIDSVRREGQQQSERLEHRFGLEVSGLRDTMDQQLRSQRQFTEQSLADLERRIIATTQEEMQRAVRGIQHALTPASARRAVPDFGFNQRTDAENLESARSLAVCRPLVPYPAWRFDSEWENPDLAFQMRRQLWTEFKHRKIERPLVMLWHHGLRVQTYLGNDVSKQLFIAGCYDPNEFAFLDEILRPGMRFVDAGANEGLYSLFAAWRVGREGQVWAFEPSEREAARLERNLQLNELKNVQVFRIALGDRCCDAELSIAGSEHAGHNTLGAFVYEQVALLRTERVPLRPLDDIVTAKNLDHLDVLKVDVEGAEVRLLEGARTTLSTLRPVLLFEAQESALQKQGSGCDALFDLLISLGYHIYTFDPKSGRPVRSEGQPLSDNLVAVPVERPLPRL